MKSKRRPAKSRDAFGRPLKKEKEKEKEPRRSKHHPPGTLGPFETDAPPVRAALHARRRAMEEEEGVEAVLAESFVGACFRGELKCALRGVCRPSEGALGVSSMSLRVLCDS